MSMIPASDFRELVVRRRDACVKFISDKPSKDRRAAMRYYRGDNLDDYGDSGDGLSSVVSRDTMEAIESMMPPLIRPFVAGEEVVSFDPFEKGDIESTEQATDYVNHVFRRYNNVLDVAQTGLKDGLLFRLGVAKTVMEESEDGAPEEFDGLDEMQLQALQAYAQQNKRELAGDIRQDPETLLYSATLAPRKVKKYCVHVIAPDEFMYEERLASLSAATFLGHTKQMPLGDLIAMGIDEKKARKLKSGKPTEEQDDRFENEGDDAEWKDDDLARPVQVDECYIRCDYQGSGTLEWRKVLIGGSQKDILTNEAIDDHPYSAWTPIPIPHKLVGLSIHDLTMDIQKQRTAIKREGMNALYLANRPQREVVDSQVNIDDLLNPTVGGIVRVKQVGMVREIPSGGTGVLKNVLTMDEALAGEREARTGVTRYNQGMDSNSLNKTATGMNIISSNSQQRQELVARQFGEFLKDIFNKLLALVSQHADPEEVARLRDKPFVPWPTEYDTTVSVGLGTNNKDQMVGHLMALAQMYERVIQLQGGVQGPLVTVQNIYEVLKRLPEAMGLKGDFFTAPDAQGEQQQPEQPQEDPMAEAKIKAQAEVEKAKIKAAADIEIERMKIDAGIGQPAPPAAPVAPQMGMMA